MTASRQNRRGGPLLALAVILSAWVGGRAITWETIAAVPTGMPSIGIGVPDARKFARRSAETSAADQSGADDKVASLLASEQTQMSWPTATVASNAGLAEPASGPSASIPYVRQAPKPAPQRMTVDNAVGHHMLWMSAISKMPLPWQVAEQATTRPVPAPFYAAGREPLSKKRWSGDAWLLVRKNNGTSLTTGAAPATYGASQVGGVVRYRLKPDSTHKPTVYVRATAALGRIADKEVAAGFSARPIPSVPVVAAAEMRVSDQSGGTDVRPAAFVVTELPRFSLPHGMRGEAYAQAGYVGGKFDTTFADGQVRIDKQVARIGKGEIRAGAGSWAGAQRGASRVDVGPSVTVGGAGESGVAARLGVDWRFRVAGDARPKSGPAVTLSAGF